MKLPAFLLASMLNAAPLTAQPIPITPESGENARAYQRWQSGRWQVLAGPDYCAADLEIPHMQFAIEAYWWTGEVRLQVMSGNWLSLRVRMGQAATLSFAVDNISVWSSSRAIIVGNGQVGGFLMDLVGPDARSVTTRLAAGAMLEITADGRTLGTYPLEGAREAMIELERCVVLMRATDRSDPFAPR